MIVYLSHQFPKNTIQRNTYLAIAERRERIKFWIKSAIILICKVQGPAFITFCVQPLQKVTEHADNSETTRKEKRDISKEMIVLD
jgi:hypothetical protein